MNACASTALQENAGRDGLRLRVPEVCEVIGMTPGHEIEASSNGTDIQAENLRVGSVPGNSQRAALVECVVQEAQRLAAIRSKVPCFRIAELDDAVLAL